MRALLVGVAVVACSGLSHRAHADEFDPSKVEYIEDPYAPHVTNGTAARLGTTVGFLHGYGQEVLAIGGTVAAGQRFGRLTLEAELTAMSLQATDLSQATLGNAERLGVIARYDVIRLGPHWVGPNSMLAFYVEGGAARAWNHWYRPDSSNTANLDSTSSRLVPQDEARVEGQLGFGLQLDHRLQEPISFPRRIGWFLGWRMSYSPGSTMTASTCRGVVCSAAQEMPENGAVIDRSMLFQSSISVMW